MVVTRPKIVVRTKEYSARDAQEVLTALRSGTMGSGAVRYRRMGDAFFLSNERSSESASENVRAGRTAHASER
jgi:hypothetical protein